MRIGYQICPNQIHYAPESEPMIAAIENYKGIEFVRISTLPEEQKRKIWTSSYQHKVIKILRDKELLSDCLPYENYVEWYEQSYKTAPVVSPRPAERAKETEARFQISP